MARVGLPCHVAGAAGCRDGGVLGGGPVLPVPAALEVGGQRAGELPGVPWEAVAGGLLDGAEQDLVLGVQPGSCLRLVGELLGDRAGLGGIQGQAVPWPVQQPGGFLGAVQVVVEQAVRRRAPVAVRALGASLIGGVRAEQVVEREPARGVLGEQAGVSEVRELWPYLGPRAAHEAGGGRGGQVGAGMQA
jgi:hypothetical protein